MVKTVVVVCEVAEVQGGAEKVAIESSLALADAGLNVVFFAASGPADPRLAAHGRVEVRLVREHYVVDELSEKERILKATYDRTSQQAFKQLIDDLDPNSTVVHLHAWRFALTSSILKPLFDSGLAVVYTLHEFGIGCPYVGFFDYRRNTICPQRGGSLGCMLTNCNRTSFKHKSWIFVKNGIIPNWIGQRRQFRHCVFVSEFSQRILQDYIAPESKQFLVRNPVEITKQEARDLQPGSPFLFVGRMTLEKDPNTLARAGRKIGQGVEFVGDGPEAATVRSENPEAILHGWLPGDQVAQQMRRAKALVFPSVWYETLGLTVYEAAANGVPAIVSDVTAACDFVEDGINGFVFRAGDADDLAEKMTKMTEQEAEQMGRAAYERYWANPMSVEAHVQGILAVYEVALGDRL